jgi:hypothetical protein
MLLISGHGFMLVVGVVELLAALIVAVKPRIGAYVVAAWLGGIIANLLILGGFYDVALRDFGPCSPRSRSGDCEADANGYIVTVVARSAPMGCNLYGPPASIDYDARSDEPRAA